MEEAHKTKKPLEGLKVLDAATMLAGPWAATHLADFGAEVVKIEHPKYGDHARKYGMRKEEIPLLWKSISRNKKNITLNLSSKEGQEIFKQILPEFDVLLENFRPGTFEKWGLDWETLKALNPSLVMLRTTGFGQEGPYSQRRGFGTVAEGMSGFTSLNGPADGPPTLPGIPLADGVSSAFGALAIMIALYERDHSESREGQYIDISLYEPLMRFLEPQLLAYDQLEYVSKRIGNSSLQTAPRNAYFTKDEKWVALSASTQSIAENVFKAIGEPQLIEDPRFVTNSERLKNVDVLDQIIGDWIRSKPMKEVTEELNEAGAVVGPMYNIDQMYEDEHYNYRESFVSVEDKELGQIRMPNVFAKFSRTPGEINTPGQEMGAFTEQFMKEQLKMTQEEIERLQEKGVL